jgi:hypothetical protein
MSWRAWHLFRSRGLTFIAGAGGRVSMRDIELFQQALGLSRPWRVDRTEFNAE